MRARPSLVPALDPLVALAQGTQTSRSGSLIGAAGRIEAHVLHKNAKDRYDKLKKIFRRLGSNFNRDDLDDFISTANSLREWIRRDPTMSQEQRDHLERFVVPASHR